MAVKARGEITLTSIVDIASTTRYYKLQSSTLAKPAKPTVNPPSGWVTNEPTYTTGATNSLYTCDLTVFSDGTWSYSDVSLSSSYEAAKDAYNKAVAAAKTATDYMEYSSSGLDVGNKVSGAWDGFRSRMAAGAFEVLNAAGAVVASYGANIIELGKNAKTAVIKMCAGALSIAYKASDITGGDAITIGGDGDLLVTATGKIVIASRSLSGGIVVDSGEAGIVIDVSHSQLGKPLQIIGGLSVGGTATHGDGHWFYATGLAATEICTNSSAAYPVYGGRVIYDNASGTTGTVTLSESAANFRYIEIFYKTNDGEVNCTRVYAPNGKLVNLASARITGAGGGGWIKSKQMQISGATMAYAGYAGESGMGPMTSGANYAGSILVTQVVGYK